MPGQLSHRYDMSKANLKQASVFGREGSIRHWSKQNVQTHSPNKYSGNERFFFVPSTVRATWHFQFSNELKKNPNKCLLNSAMNFLAHMYTWQCVWSTWQFSDELSCLGTCVHTHGKFSNKLSCPHVKQLSKLQKTIQRWTFLPKRGDN